MNFQNYLFISLFFLLIGVYLYKLMSDSQLKFYKEYIDSSKDQLLATYQNELSNPSVDIMNDLNTELTNLGKDFAVFKNTTKKIEDRLDTNDSSVQGLTEALKSPNVKGNWGEMTLKRSMEFVGLSKYCNFEEQVSIDSGEKRLRPDCVLTLPGQKSLIIDSKLTLDNYRKYYESNDPKEKGVFLSEHIKRLKRHIDDLSKKKYQEYIQSNKLAIDSTILFIPIEGALSITADKDPNIISYALDRNIILAYPTSLICILKYLSMSLQNIEINKNIVEIENSVVKIYKSLIRFIDYYSSVGSSLNSLTKIYNQSIGSFNKTLIPQIKKFSSISNQNDDIETLEEIENSPRMLTSKSN